MNPSAPVRVESTTLGPYFTEMRGEWLQTRELFYVLIFLMLLDIASGMLCAYRRKAINSSASFEGFRKKGMMVLLVVALAAMDPIVTDINLALWMTRFWMFTEVLSITENAASIGLGVPVGIKEVLSKLRETAPQKVEVQGIVSVSQDPATAATRVVSSPADPVHVVADATVTHFPPDPKNP